MPGWLKPATAFNQAQTSALAFLAAGRGIRLAHADDVKLTIHPVQMSGGDELLSLTG